MKISGVYKITNTITGDFYIGSSKDVKRRWREHKWPSTWKKCPNNPMYQDMQNYGIEKFELQILAEIEVDKLKEMEQEFIEKLQPTYNNRNANGLNVERKKETHKEYQKEYRKTDKCKAYQKEHQKQYYNQLCCYNGETITLNALSMRFRRKGIPHPTQEAKKYLIKKESKTPIEFYDVYP